MAISSNDYIYLFENILNIVMFMPIGVLVPNCIFYNKHRYIKTVLFSCLLSGIIEVIQLVTRRGWFETCDLIHNIIGAFLGCMLCEWVLKRYDRR